MRTESIAFGVAGILFGLIAGWVIGTEQARQSPVAPTAAAVGSPATSGATPRAAVVDEAKVNAYRSVAEREANNAAPRVELGNLYFDAERYDEAIRWYSEALAIKNDDPNVSTDLGVSYYYTNQADKAIAQFEQSLEIDPKHAKTMLNMGIVKAFGKQDLEGAAAAWQRVIEVAPQSQEAQAAKRALDGLKSAHPTGASGPPGG